MNGEDNEYMKSKDWKYYKQRFVVLPKRNKKLMIDFNRFTLENGLKVIVHEDHSTSMAAVNLLYQVGARDEHPNQTGFAHLFEHLMFGGSKHAPSFDEPLQRAGGENNAFTNNDITNYYDLLPANNIEVAFWLESDRMKYLNINQKSLDVQKKVVCEEFRENYLNQPYGDLWHKISELAYKVHPYRWPTIGKELSHVENAQLKDVRHFFNTYYRPNNAIMVVSGHVTTKQIEELAKKWFGEIESNPISNRIYPKEPPQKEAQHLNVYADVPSDSLIKIYHTGNRWSKDYYRTDLISDILSHGTSSRLYQKLIKQKKLFSEIDAYVTGTLDEGLLIVETKLNPEINMSSADEALTQELELIIRETISEKELEKIKNQAEATAALSEVNLLTRTINLAYYELLGDAGRINTEIDTYLKITPEDILDEAQKTFQTSNCSTIYYHAQNKN